jgi:hypothetical protein
VQEKAQLQTVEAVVEVHMAQDHTPMVVQADPVS